MRTEHEDQRYFAVYQKIHSCNINLNSLLLKHKYDNNELSRCSQFRGLYGSRPANNIEILRTRLSARDDEPVFDQPFGAPKNDQDAAKFGDRLSGIGLYQYPVSLASEAILAHPSCQLTVCPEFPPAKEVSFGKEMQGIWIDVITSKSPKESTLPNVNNELG
ncbi:hypothetical protein BGZ67_008342 [Mortierella alpina]|nr:hypothetical protein BGZ67_008342 [Mortierella alpina]